MAHGGPIENSERLTEDHPKTPNSTKTQSNDIKQVKDSNMPQLCVDRQTSINRSASGGTALDEHSSSHTTADERLPPAVRTADAPLYHTHTSVFLVYSWTLRQAVGIYACTIHKITAALQPIYSVPQSHSGCGGQSCAHKLTPNPSARARERDDSLWMYNVRHCRSQQLCKPSGCSGHSVCTQLTPNPSARAEIEPGLALDVVGHVAQCMHTHWGHRHFQGKLLTCEHMLWKGAHAVI